MNKKLQRGIVVILITNVINMLFSFATNFLLPKYLSVESYAGIKEFQLYVSYVGLFHFGFVDGIYLRYGGKNIDKQVDEKFSTNLSTMRIFQILITVISIVVSIILKDTILLIFSLSILPQNMSNYYKFLYQATGEFDLYGKAMNITTISTFILNMVLLFVFKIDNLYIYCIGYLFVFIGIWLILEIGFKKKHTFEKGSVFSFTALVENIKSGFLLTLGNLSSMFLTTMDRWFVKFLMNTLTFAQYSFAVSIENFLNLAITPVTTTLYNYFCRENNMDQLRKIYNYVIIFSTLIPAAAFPVKFIVNSYINKYADANRIIFLLFASQIFYIVIKGIYVNLYKVQRRQNIYFIKLITVLCIGFIFNCLFYLWLKTKEAFAIGTLLSSIVWFFISKRDFEYIYNDRKTEIYLFVELFSFIFLGFNFNPFLGLITYLVITIIFSWIFMNKTMKELYFMLKKVF